ncbi:MAG: CBS domain-containing protein [Myxococcaceae bacterium]|nr:CBS domain-containing protein [Myxococcaceae bacterium]
MKASGVMTKEVRWASSDMTLQEAYGVMSELNIRHLPIIERGRLCGIVSDRDLLLRATRTDDGDLVLSPLVVGDVMSVNPVTCRGDDSVATVAHLMIKHGIDCVPVTDVGEELKGLITSRDLVALVGLLDTLPES